MNAPCSVCGSLACLVQSPDFCRTVNRYRPGTAVVEEIPAVSTVVKVKAGTSVNRSKS